MKNKSIEEIIDENYNPQPDIFILPQWFIKLLNEERNELLIKKIESIAKRKYLQKLYNEYVMVGVRQKDEKK